MFKKLLCLVAALVVAAPAFAQTTVRSMTPPLPIGSGGTGQTAAQAGAYALKTPYVLHQSGATVTNTAISTSEVNLVSAAFPALGANDALRITVLWNTGGTVTDSKNVMVKFGTGSCTPLTTCASPGTAAYSATFNTSSLVTAFTETIVRNANATNAQNFFAVNQVGPGNISGSIATGAVQTNAGGFVNIDCTTATSTADSCGIVGYTIELVPGN